MRMAGRQASRRITLCSKRESILGMADGSSMVSETRPAALHRVHYNPGPELIDLDNQIWKIEKAAGSWRVYEKLGKA